jgi:hypothetical protein
MKRNYHVSSLPGVQTMKVRVYLLAVKIVVLKKLLRLPVLGWKRFLAPERIFKILKIDGDRSWIFYTLHIAPRHLIHPPPCCSLYIRWSKKDLMHFLPFIIDYWLMEGQGNLKLYKSWSKVQITSQQPINCLYDVLLHKYW